MEQRQWRAFHALIFLLALHTTYAVWAAVGGQGHLDQIDWRWKLALGLSLAYSTGKTSASAVAGDRAWNARALRWLSIVLALVAAMIAVTYYYHLLEPPEEEEESIAESANPSDQFRLPAGDEATRRGRAGEAYWLIRGAERLLVVSSAVPMRNTSSSLGFPQRGAHCETDLHLERLSDDDDGVRARGCSRNRFPEDLQCRFQEISSTRVLFGDSPDLEPISRYEPKALAAFRRAAELKSRSCAARACRW